MGVKPDCSNWESNVRLECLRISVIKGGEVKEEWKKLRDEEINDLHPSPNIIRVIK